MKRSASGSDAALRLLATKVAARLKRARETLVTAESCTGGFLAKCLTDRPGSSDWFERGWVTYSNEAKQAELGVTTGQLARFGAVSEEVAIAMVRGALAKTGANHAVSVTGVAGPTGGSRAKPVGTVWIGWGYRSEDRVRVHATLYHFRGSRDAVRRRSVAAALQGLLES
ncbi:MAG TPA: CinA family protein [Steroidobacteraceae bacterium]|jgi:nicotinamide-nucleotide amidase|nr:CinA family protein [Steroidobacteraceae bacterium]